MMGLYLLLAMLSASVVIKLVRPLQHPGPGMGAVPRRPRLAWLGAIMALPLLALALYLLRGAPDLPSQPMAFRDIAVRADRSVAMLAVRPMQILLADDGENLGALLDMGQLNLRLGKAEAAARYYEQAAIVAARQNDWRLRLALSMQGESMVAANNGTVPDDALAVFDHVLHIFPNNGPAQYYKALYMAQHGQRAEAVKIWMDLLSQGDNTIYWKQRVRESLAATREEMRREQQH